MTLFKELELSKKNTQDIFSRQLNLIIYILKNHTLRISEVLRLDSKCLSSNKKIIVKLSKCNDYLTLFDKYLYDELFDIFITHKFDHFTMNYKNVYYFFQKYHPEFIISGITTNNKVTHSFRYRNAKLMKKEFNNEKITQSDLHHKSKASQKYYLATQKKK